MLRTPVDQLARGEFDILMADITITKDRIQKIDFSIPFESYGIVIIMKKSSSLENHIFVFMNPLSSDVWMAIGGSLILVVAILSITVTIRQEANPSVVHCAWLCVASLVGQGVEDVPR